MKPMQIEDTIIAYFDGRLSDADSAELLHRVSVSPEIRAIFRQHQELSEVAKNAARNVTVRPEIESKVFANIAALQQEERKGLAPIPEPASTGRVAIRRTAIAASLLALLLAGSALYLEVTRSHSPSEIAIRGQAPTPQHASPHVQASEAAPSLQSAGDLAGSPETDRSYGTYWSYQSHSLANPNTSASTRTVDARASAAAEAPSEPIHAIAPQSVSSIAVLDPDRLSWKKFQVTDVRDADYDRFELGLETATGFNSPADRGSFTPFGEQRVHVGYFVTPNDQFGVRLTHALYQTLEEQRDGMAGVYSSIDRTNVATWQFAEEAYYGHRFDLPGGLMVDGSAGGGLLSNGWLASLELGLKLPMSSHVIAGVSFSLSRVHSNAPTVQDLMEEGTATPMILSGSDVHNTLNGRIQYGLSYRF